MAATERILPTSGGVVDETATAERIAPSADGFFSSGVIDETSASATGNSVSYYNQLRRQ